MLVKNVIVPFWEVACEVRWRAKNEHVDIGGRSKVRALDHGRCEAIGGVYTSLSQDVRTVDPLLVALVVILGIKCAAIEDGKVLVVLHVQTDLVSVLHISADAWRVD